MYTIRAAIPDDAPNFHTSHLMAIEELAGEIPNHSKLTSDDLEKSLKENVILLVEQEQQITGFGHVKVLNKDKHLGIMGIYLSDEASSLPIATELLKLLVEKAKGMDIIKLTVCSTPDAISFYRDHSFTVIKDEVAVKVGGVSVKLIPMEIIL